MRAIHRSLPMLAEREHHLCLPPLTADKRTRRQAGSQAGGQQRPAAGPGAVGAIRQRKPSAGAGLARGPCLLAWPSAQGTRSVPCVPTPARMTTTSIRRKGSLPGRSRVQCSVVRGEHALWLTVCTSRTPHGMGSVDRPTMGRQPPTFGYAARPSVPLGDGLNERVHGIGSTRHAVDLLIDGAAPSA
ncbi:uncharacterized protein PFL1_03504 [Pseudozyma flocculosa PF-1]|uniref:Uncharacterized protein n=1 Tax=Pseudozyma flocculosa PF-1 TaxID=1277687 RepID=A0A061H8J8_9BASI|nr:uncharacterized protein PFL1_03504 [Pseudozyma flocculosa PF-1]EPQ29217.1 hypothetical protein PFL1_03504 [Pseudozyma flocculosa PF-1]